MGKSIAEAYRETLQEGIRKAGEVFARPALNSWMCGFVCYLIPALRSTSARASPIPIRPSMSASLSTPARLA